MSTTFAQALDNYVAALQRKKARPRTLKERVRVVRFWASKLDVLAGDPKQLAEWRTALGKRYNNEQISEATVRSAVLSLRGFYAANPELFPTNPAAGLDLGPAPQWRPRPMPMRDVQLLLAQVNPRPNGPGSNDLDTGKLYDRAMLELLLNGLRRNEVVELRTNALRYDPSEYTLIATVQGKGGRVGDVPLNPESAEYVALHCLYQFAADDAAEWVREFQSDTSKYGSAADQELMARQAALLAFERLRRVKLKDAAWHVFRGLTVSVLNKRFAKYRDQAGLSKYTSAAGRVKAYGPHSLRHTCATELLNGGVDSMVIKDIMRHSSVAVTQIYMQVETSIKAKAMRQLRRMS
jgi:site-specific recombinase XerD